MGFLYISRLIVLLSMFCITTGHAELNSKERLRAFAKLPNWSGYWEHDGVSWAASGDPTLSAEMMQERRTFHPPYNGEWEARFQAAWNNTANVSHQAQCVFGFPQLMVFSPFMFQAIVTPEKTTLIFSYRETRHIYTNGRSHPATDEFWPTPWGDSIGHWEDQTLVVETIATTSSMFTRKPNVAQDEYPNVSLPLSEQARYIERIRMLDANTLENQITINDPVALTGAWKFTRRYKRVTDVDRFIDEDCTGNERNPVVNDKFTVAPR